MYQVANIKKYIQAVISRCGQLLVSLFSQVRPYIFIAALLIGILGSTLLTSESVYAAPDDYTTQAECEAENYEWDGDANKCVEPAESSCGIEGIGWVVCPVMDFLGGVADMAFNFLADSFLSIKAEYVNSVSVESAWGVMRTLANVVFVIAFLVIIFSQLTSTGISNYGVKKLLPRLIIAAILVNLSLFICQIAVDISNILGYSLKTLFDTLGNEVLLPRPSEDPTGVDTALTGLGWATLIASLLVGGITLALSISGPVILAAVLALLLIALILVARIALITTLTIISPLAFVAFLLPNTEQWFKKWYKMFIALLMVFPIIAVVFGASALVAEVINETAIPRDASGQPNGDPTNLLMQVIAMGVATVPLFLVPSLLKNSMSAAGSIGDKLSGWSSKASGRVGSRVKDSSQLGRRMQEYKAGRERARTGRAIRSRNSKFGRGIDAMAQKAGVSSLIGSDRGAILAAEADTKLFDEEVGLQQTALKGKNEGQWLDIMKNSKSEHERAAAAGLVMKSGSRGAQLAALETVRGLSASGDKHAANMQKQMYADMSGKPFALGNQSAAELREGTYGSTAASGSRTVSQEFDQRVATKLTAEGLASMDPDEVDLATRMAKDGQLSSEAMQSLTSNIQSVRDDEILNKKVGAKTNQSFNEILAASQSTSQPSGAATPPANGGSSTGGSTASPATPTPSTPSSGSGSPGNLSIPHSQPSGSSPSRPTARPTGGSSVDTAGRHTPSSATEDYHDRMSR